MLKNQCSFYKAIFDKKAFYVKKLTFLLKTKKQLIIEAVF